MSKSIDKIDEVLKLALEALESCSAGDYSTGHVIHPSFDVDTVNKAIEVIDEALMSVPDGAEQPAPATELREQQEPVAWGNLANWCLDSDRVLITDKDEAVKYHRDVYDLTPLYTSPPNVPTARASKPLSNLTEDNIPAFPWVSQSAQRKPLTEEQADKIIAALEPLLDLKNQSWKLACDRLKEIVGANPAPTQQPAQREPVAWADDCRIELVTAIHFITSDYENALGAFGEDVEARRKAEGDIAHARKIAAKWNWNGRTSPPAKKPWVGLTDEDIQEVRENCGITHHAIKTIEAKLREKNA